MEGTRWSMKIAGLTTKTNSICKIIRSMEIAREELAEGLEEAMMIKRIKCFEYVIS